ncbi:heme ABC transporter ATP-binding protein [Pseudoclavibacter sp. RFBJ3]|uniref:ABC-F family ATP-binding cassette domain-containing protein n=1 Tax=unclassified Pseudoclavibacter TaxID=2615177 RepID=UPI000CE8E38E|nr:MULTISPECIES: ABC-F family ATP-binding cassette domain-containing protein [unclassified Pseudoclavibacter]PPF83023.1 heme ABC transporter ATP-binding protein [Pseudoclavibacter sp. RFBJ5]PPF91722.1 heme ABC transporter ATP-binding protein [Pseudoclavibacter sp. RFBJ3]PPF95539.1 heme ABC transporter ATP-binding protein [Pseudoclavibacter sp. RFBH5]PPG19582.1 heme ABC transporter ATP-binding protein [Pseudoclavibacter sp. RFBI4]
MTATLVAKDLAGGHDHRTLFSSLDLVVAPGDVIGVVGANGAGKSTLLRLLAGIDEPMEGSVSLAPADAFIGWLPQEHERVAGETVAQYVGRRTGTTEATAEMDAAAEALAEEVKPGAPDPGDVYAVALERWLASGAADLEERLPVVLAELGLELSADALMTSLSGGQAARVGLAALLLSRFDIVLLDEPTNDLDLDGLERLEAFIQGLRGGVVLVSHDREFLARSVTRVLELDLAQHSNHVYGGGYEAFLEERATAKRHAREEYEEFADKKADLVGRARTQREWSSQGVRNAMRKAPDNDKIRRKAATESSEKQAQKVRQMESRIARLDEVEEPRKEWQLQFTIGTAPRSSSVVSTLSRAELHLGSFTFGPVSVQVDAGDRIGITGPNGAGKSTLLRLLLGHIQPDSGTASLGSSVALGEIDQARAALTGPAPLAEQFEAQVPDWPTAEVRTLLAKFGLKADHVGRRADELSPGERTRAGLALLQARGVNLLVLDEPTNHLDLVAIEQLEQALESYEGTLLLVTHDRRMLETVQLNRAWHVEGGQLTER